MTELSESVQVHASAIVDPGAQIGPGTRVWHFSHVCSQAKIGRGCVLGQNVFVGNDVLIGNNVKIQNNVSVYDAVTLEDDVFCGPSMVFTNVINPRSHVIRKSEYKRTCVRKGASIGANATIVCGVEIGEFAFIGAGAVVTRNVLPHALVAGVPARHIGWVCRCGVRLVENQKQHFHCPECALHYLVIDGRCKLKETPSHAPA